MNTSHDLQAHPANVPGRPVGAPGRALGDWMPRPFVTAVLTLVATVLALLVVPAAEAGAAEPCPNEALRAGASAGLPECRGYELVTAGPKVNGWGVGWNFSGDSAAIPGTASAEGDRLISATATNVLGEPAFAFAFDYNLHERTSDGWVARSVANRRNYSAAGGIGSNLVPMAVSPDLSTQAWAGQLRAFLFEEMADWPQSIGVNYLRGWDGAWTVMSPQDPAQQIAATVGTTLISGDGSSVLLSSSTRNLLGASDPSQDQLAAANGGKTLYQADVAGGVPDGLTALQPSVVNVGVCTGSGADRTELPSRTADPTPLLATRSCPDGPEGRAGLISNAGASVGVFNAASNIPTENALSQDGSRLFFQSPDPAANRVASACTGTDATTSCPPQVYVRQVLPGQPPATRWISRPRVPGQAASLLGKAVFDGASGDGSTVLFRTTSPLTADDPNGQPIGPPDPRPITSGTASTNSWDVYEYRMPADPTADPGDGSLTRITAGPTGDSDPQAGNVSGTIEPVRFVSDDGSHVYFVTAKPLDGVAAPTDGTSTIPGQSGTLAFPTALNLYLYDATKTGSERWEFIAQLPNGTSPLSMCATSAPTPGQPLGPNLEGVQSLVGASCVRGTPDGRLITFMTAGQLVAGDEDAAYDLYVYDQRSDSLKRISVPQSVSGPSTSYSCAPSGPDSGATCNADLGFTPTVATVPLPNIADDGTGHPAVLFQSKRRLLPEAPDGIYSVYSWRDGRLSLVTPGTEEGGAYYSGNSVDGRNVFVETRQKLAWEDLDSQMDIYDARVDGGFPEPPAPPGPCQGDACQPPPAQAPQPPSIGSVSFVGDGNVQPAPHSVSPSVGVSKRRTVAGQTVRLRVRVPAAGRLSVSGRWIRGTRRPVSRAGTYSVTLRLSAGGKRVLSAKGRLTVKATVVYRAQNSRSASKVVRVTFKQPKAKRAKARKGGDR